MGDENTWRIVLDIISRYENPVIVVSATARTTRQLVAAGELATDDINQALEISRSIKERHHKLVQAFLEDTDHQEKEVFQKACSNRIDDCISTLDNLLQAIAQKKSLFLKDKDAIASFGEQLSAYLFAQCGMAYGFKTRWIDARKIIKTDSDFGQANPDSEKITHHSKIIQKSIVNGFIPVLGGFYGENKEGQVTTLGFEGSDYTASLIGAAIRAKTIEIWTDVSGIYTCDPNVVQHAQSIPELSFQEATEMAYFGAKVLHPSTMKPAAAARIPVLVKNIFDSDQPGTKIHTKQATNGIAKAIAYLKDITILTITSNGLLKGHHFLGEVFKYLDQHHITVNAVTTTEASVSVALKSEIDVEEIQQQYKEIGTVNSNKHQGLISLIGCDFSNSQSVNSHIFSAIPDVTPSLISYSKRKQNLNIAVPEMVLIPAVCNIHDRIFNGE